MSVSLDEMQEIAKRNADEALKNGHVELAKNAVDVWVDAALTILDLDSLADRADCEDCYETDSV